MKHSPFKHTYSQFILHTVKLRPLKTHDISQVDGTLLFTDRYQSRLTHFDCCSPLIEARTVSVSGHSSHCALPVILCTPPHFSCSAAFHSYILYMHHCIARDILEI